jgi:hypothetical protein
MLTLYCLIPKPNRFYKEKYADEYHSETQNVLKILPIQIYSIGNISSLYEIYLRNAKFNVQKQMGFILIK